MGRESIRVVIETSRGKVDISRDYEDWDDLHSDINLIIVDAVNSLGTLGSNWFHWVKATVERNRRPRDRRGIDVVIAEIVDSWNFISPFEDSLSLTIRLDDLLSLKPPTSATHATAWRLDLLEEIDGFIKLAYAQDGWDFRLSGLQPCLDAARDDDDDYVKQEWERVRKAADEYLEYLGDAEPDEPAVLNRRIDQLGLSARTVSACQTLGVVTVRDLCKIPARELLRVRNFGEVNLHQVREFLSVYNLHLLGDQPDYPSND